MNSKRLVIDWIHWIRCVRAGQTLKCAGHRAIQDQDWDCGTFFFFSFFFENWKIKLCHPKQALTTTPEIHNHQIFPIFSAVNGTAFEIGFIWFIDMCTHVSFLQVIALIKLHQESTLLHLRAHRDPIYFLISNITHSSCGKHR